MRLLFCLFSDGYNPKQMRKVKALFEAYDGDGNEQLDVREVTTGLVSCGVLINERQSKALIKMLDQNKDGGDTVLSCIVAF